MSPNARDEKDSAWQNHSHRRYRVHSILTFSIFFPRSSFRSEVKDLLSRLSWVAMFHTMTVNIYIKIIYVNCGLRNEFVSDLCSVGHYLSSSENKS